MIITMTVQDIGASLRARRQALGWSLAEVARRAGTSAPSVHRYESGWRRFELYTLSKLATALGCRLRIFLEPLDLGGRPPSARSVRDRIGRLFWERRLRRADLTRYPAWVIARVLEYGKLDDVRILISYLGKRRFLELLQQVHLPSAKTRSFWDAILQQEGRSCTRKFSRKEAAASWIV